MEGTGIRKRIGKCDMFHVALFVPTFRARRNADVVQLLGIRSKSTLTDVLKQKTQFATFDFQSLKILIFPYI